MYKQGMSMIVANKARLPDGRRIKAVSNSKGEKFSQEDIFGIKKLLLPSEDIMTLREHDIAIHSGAYEGLEVDLPWRCREYGFYRKTSKAPLGNDISWIEFDVTYQMLIPDVPVRSNGNEISLQKAVGMGIYDSVGLLKIEQMDTDLFVVSVIDPAAVIGKVRVVDFMKNGWALTDETGLPLANMPSSQNNPNARMGGARADFDDFDVRASGWHGSLSRGLGDRHYDSRRCVVAGGVWFYDSRVTVASSNE